MMMSTVELTSHLKQQGYIDHDQPSPLGCSLVYKSSPSCRDNRMHKIFETLERAHVAKHKMRKPLAINSTLEEHTRKNVLDRFCSSAGIEVAHCGVSVKDWRAKLDKH